MTPRYLVAAVLLALAPSCGGSSEQQTGSSGGTAPNGGSSAQGGGSGGAQAAQGGSSSGGTAGDSGGSSSGGTASGSGGSGGTQCDPGCVPLCEGGMRSCYCEATCANFTAPPFDKSCETEADCFAGVHTKDCCGSKIVLGYNVLEMARFEAYEANCTSRAVCRCATGPPMLEGGQVTTDIEQRFAQCTSGQCLGNGPVSAGR